MEDKTYRVSVIKILDFAFMVNEDLYQDEISPKFVIGQQSGFNVEREHFNLIIQVSYFYNIDTPVAEIEVQNVFHIKGIKELYNANTNNLDLPPDLILTALSLSLSHTRALFAKNLRATRYGNVILPPFDPLAIAKKVFPRDFADKEYIEDQQILSDN